MNQCYSSGDRDIHTYYKVNFLSSFSGLGGHETGRNEKKFHFETDCHTFRSIKLLFRTRNKI